MTVVTRFAPSPTGFLHIGGARTALFNWLFAKHHGGKFLLRIEDTDRARSTQEAVNAILDGLKWLELDWDGEVMHQFARAKRHAEAAKILLEQDKAFLCYHTPEELAEWRRKNDKSGIKFISDWREGKKPPRDGVPPVIRIRAPSEGETTIHDKVKGTVTIKNSEIDDITLLRSDGTPTYMHAVVVDDHDMNITHVIRGDDHFTNTFRQAIIYEAMGWQAPVFAHVPLIHGADGAKLSKRHGALGVDAYREMGYLPEALRNYLLRLGWAHGDDETISTAQAIAWFSLEGIGKSPSRFDFVKLENLNGHYIRAAEDKRLVEMILPYFYSPLEGESKRGGVSVGGAEKTMNTPHDSLRSSAPPQGGSYISVDIAYQRLLRGMAGLKQRAKTIKELAHNAAFYVAKRPLKLDEKAQKLLEGNGRDTLSRLMPHLKTLEDWSHTALEQLARAFAESSSQKLGDVAQPLRAALTGRSTSPSVFEVMEILGKEESLERLRDVC